MQKGSLEGSLARSRCDPSWQQMLGLDVHVVLVFSIVQDKCNSITELCFESISLKWGYFNLNLTARLFNLCNNVTWGEWWLFYLEFHLQLMSVHGDVVEMIYLYKELKRGEDWRRACCCSWLFIPTQSEVVQKAIGVWQNNRGAGKHKVSDCLCCIVAGEKCFTPVWEKYFMVLSHG